MDYPIACRELALLRAEGDAALRLRQVRAALLERGEASLPCVEGLDGHLVARWLYRTWLEEHADWGPLVCVHRDHWEAGALDWVETASGGWIHLGDGISPTRALRERAQAVGALLLVQDASEVLTAPPSWVDALCELDLWHGVASDPGLSALRRSLLSHCRAEAVAVHLVGEPGVGKGALVGWAHAQLDDRPLSVLSGAQGRWSPGQWLLAKGIGELGEAQKTHLTEALRHLEPPPRRRLTAQAADRPQDPALESLVGRSAALTEVLDKVLKLAPSRLPVLLQGEPGVGKELLARAVHRASGRRGAFVALDVGAIAENLAESMLFGHRKGAFTGADRDRKGAFRSAEGGTLFLDELGNLSPALQIRLLRVLQEGQVQPLGFDKPIKVDVRVVAASNADLRSMVRRGTFRADLLGRLDAATMRVPPLRERLEDLEILGRVFLERQWGQPAPEPWCSPQANQALLQHNWPGNIRELNNVLSLAATMTPPGSTIEARHLGPLAPRNRRRVPVLTTHNSEGREGWGLDRAQVQRLTLTSLRVPALRDRSSASRRAAVLDVLGQRPVAPAVLRLLEESPWWGNFPELRATLSALRRLPPGPLGLSAIQEHMPHLAHPVGAAPIRTLLVPRRDALGRVVGLTQNFEASALLVGRVSGVEGLSRAARSGDARSAMWLRELKARVGDGLVACLDLSLLPRISRAHLLVTRSQSGLRLHRMPATGLAVQVRSLGPQQQMQSLAQGEVGELGPAAAVQFLSQSGRVYLEMFLFAGAVAYEEFSAWALRDNGGDEALPSATVLQTRAESSVPRPSVGGALRVWGLDVAEIEALNSAVMSFRGGQLKQHVLMSLQGAKAQRLHAFFKQAPRFSQYLVRLYELPENKPLRRDLRQRLQRDSERELRLSLLPRGLRRCVEH